MKLLNREQIETLSKFQSNDYFVTSFFLDTSKNRMSKKEIQLSFKNLLNTSKLRLDGLSFPKAKKDSLYADLELIKSFGARTLADYKYVGLAVFSCSKLNFWQEFNLVKSPRNLIIFEHNPYTRPLSAILDEYHRTCLLTFDGKSAKWYEIYMGDITLRDSLSGDVPAKVREGGWEGYSSKRIERHRASKLQAFFKQIAKNTFDLMEKEKFDWLFLGCQDEYCQELEPLLHPYVQKKLKTRIKVKPTESTGKVLPAVLAAKDQIKREEKERIVENFVSEVGKNGLAVSGLGYTLRKLNRGEVQTLLVTRHISKPGRMCPKCRFLFAEESTCPSCRIKTEKLLDVIDEAVENALNSSCNVKHINPPSGLDDFGGIGAFLRYKA